MDELPDHCPKLPWMIYLNENEEGKVAGAQLKAAFARNWVDYLCELNFESKPADWTLTQIMCTIGPNSADVQTLENLMAAGMTIARLDLSYYTREACREVIYTIRKATDKFSKSLGRVYNLAIAIDLDLMNIKTGKLKDLDAKDVKLEEGKTITLTGDPAYEEFVTDEILYVDYESIGEVLHPGDQVLIDDGRIKLNTVEVSNNNIKCVVEKAGRIAAMEKVSFPAIPLEFKNSENYQKNLQFGIAEAVDIILISTLAGSEIISSVKEILGEEGRGIMVVPKVEHSAGIKNIDELIEKCDGIMLARDILALNIPKEKLLLIQKCISGKCLRQGIPCIVTIRLSEVEEESLTSCEVLDIGNTLLDGIDCISLTKDIALKDVTPDQVKYLFEICREAESGIYQKQLLNNLAEIECPMEPIYILAVSVVEASMKCNASAIILCTTSGRTAKVISRYRPRCPIIALTRHNRVARQLQLFRGIRAILYINPPKLDWSADVDQQLQLGITYGKVRGLIKAGDNLILVMPTRQGAGFTNAMKIVYASEHDCPAPVTING